MTILNFRQDLLEILSNLGKSRCDISALIVDIDLNAQEFVLHKTFEFKDIDESLLKVKNEFTPDKPIFILIRLDNNSNSPSWVLLSYKPQGCSLKNKFTFSAAEKIILNFLNRILYIPIISFQNKDDLNRKNCLRILEGEEKFFKPFADSELDRILENVSQNSFPSVKALLPSPLINFSSSFIDSIKEYNNFNTSINCIIMKIDQSSNDLLCETLRHVKLRTLLNDLPRSPIGYYLIRVDEDSDFFLWCTDASSKQDRILYAVCKLTILKEVEHQGVHPSRIYDARHPSEVSEAISFQDYKKVNFLNPWVAKFSLPVSKKIMMCDNFLKDNGEIRF